MGDLHQYVIEEDPVRVKPVVVEPKGPRVINLDDRYVCPVSSCPSTMSCTYSKAELSPPTLPTSKPKWTGPPNIAIYLSSIELPDLKPKPKPKPPRSSPAPIATPAPAPVAAPLVVRPPATAPKPNTLQARPTRSDRPGGSLPTPSPPEGTGAGGHRKSSFSRMFGR